MGQRSVWKQDGMTTPQYLLKALIPMHPHLRLAGEACSGLRGMGFM
jgi:hypothetical protein